MLEDNLEDNTGRGNAERSNAERRLWLAIDAVGYGRRSDTQKNAVQTALRKTVGKAADQAGLHSATWDTQVSGDGQISAIPAGESEQRVVDDFVRHLVAQLHRHNEPFRPEERLRLRIAIHHAPYLQGPNGWNGRAPVEVTRLVDSELLRSALDSKQGPDVAVALSDPVYMDLVAAGSTSLDTHRFRPVEVRGKSGEASHRAWLWVPDGRADGGVRRRPRILVLVLVVVLVATAVTALFVAHSLGAGGAPVPAARVTIEPGAPYGDGSRATARLTTARAAPRPGTRRLRLAVSDHFPDQVLCRHNTTVSVTLHKNGMQSTTGALHDGDTFGVPLEAGRTDAALDLVIASNPGCAMDLSFDDVTPDE
ncbi:hypothetical protein ACMATS_29885 [Streptoverticillium reticulum]|uniref:hypothetical protein n=1 Tax=Streptoverticillium reticulum TaxID=1433415 RepID=UPI0039BEFB82